MIQAIPTGDPSGKPVGQTVDRLRDTLPPDAMVGGAIAENHDLEQALSSKLAPVLLRLMGKWAWWLPKPLGRLLPNVRFGHA